MHSHCYLNAKLCEGRILLDTSMMQHSLYNHFKPMNKVCDKIGITAIEINSLTIEVPNIFN